MNSQDPSDIFGVKERLRAVAIASKKCCIFYRSKSRGQWRHSSCSVEKIWNIRFPLGIFTGFDEITWSSQAHHYSPTKYDQYGKMNIERFQGKLT